MKENLSKEKFAYLFYVLKHPIDGFYEVRHRDKGSILIAFLLVFLFSISYTINRMFASFVVNDIDPRNVDSMEDLKGVVIIYLVFCVANWSITCLLEGEGRFKDILTAVGYALLPLVLTYIPATLISQLIAANEEAFYTILIGIGTAWTGIMALIGIMTIHNYSLGKTIITVGLTLVAMLIIIFLFMLLSSLVDQVYLFFRSIYTELIYRT